MLIRAINPDVDYYERTNLQVPSIVGATALTVQNTTGFANTNPIMVGEMGRETTEISAVSGSPTSTNLPVTALVFPHSGDETVYKLRYNKVKFYKSTTGINGSYNLLTTIDIDVTNENLQTYYDDPAGLATHYYKISFYNSISDTETQLSDPVQGSGYSRNTVGSLLDEVLHEVRDENELITDRQEMIGWLNEVNDDIITRSSRPLPFLKTTATLPVVAGQNYVDLPSDLFKLKDVYYRWTVSGQVQEEKVKLKNSVDYERLTGHNPPLMNSDYLKVIGYDDVANQILMYPAPYTSRSDGFIVVYYKSFDVIQSEGDILETPNPMVYKKYLMGQYYLRRGATESGYIAVSDRYMGEYNSQVAKLERLNRKDLQPRSFKRKTR